jgi:beta-glucosidase
VPDISALLDALTLEEKISLIGGRDVWHTNGIDHLGIPSMKVTDGPNGARGDGVLGTGAHSATCIPCGSALGATFDPDLLSELGDLLGRESHSKAAHVLLAPTMNLHRHPLGGRNFECYSEDPELTGKLAAAFIRGVQGQGVATTAKHFVGNDSEFERNTINTVVDERALRELYLRPFELSISEGGAWGVMSSYNRLNGPHASEHEWLLSTVLRDEWGFDGFVISDWYGTKSGPASIEAGLDLEMPGPAHFYSQSALVTAVEKGQITEDAIDLAVHRLLVLMERTNAFENPKDHDESSVDSPTDRALCRRAAVESVVMLKNEGALPLDSSSLKRLAVIGPNASVAQIMGGGSANLKPHYWRTPLDAIRDRLGDHVEIDFHPGCSIDKTVPPVRGPELRAPDGTVGMEVIYFDGHAFEGDPVHTEVVDSSRLMTFGTVIPNVDMKSFSYRAVGTYTPAVTGNYTIALVEVGRAKVFIDSELVLNGWDELPPRDETFFGMGSIELKATVGLVADKPVELKIEYSSQDSMILNAAVVGLLAPLPDDPIAEAAAGAATADAAIIVVGTNNDWETEGNDRATMDLPGDQAELIRAVAAANPNSIVVVNAGSCVDVSWASEVNAALNIWFGGQEMSEALVDVLLGEADPGGRLPTTFPTDVRHAPSHFGYPGENGTVHYGEGIFAGYRGYDAADREPAFAFGHGLSYATFDWGQPDVATTARAGDSVTVKMEVTNSGSRAGTDVVQLYVHHESPRLARPDQELKSFQKVHLEPGESTMVELVLDARAFSYFDPGEVDGVMPAALGNRARNWSSERGWKADPGRYELRLSRSSRNHIQSAWIELS